MSTIFEAQIGMLTRVKEKGEEFVGKLSMIGSGKIMRSLLRAEELGLEVSDIYTLGDL